MLLLVEAKNKGLEFIIETLNMSCLCKLSKFLIIRLYCEWLTASDLCRLDTSSSSKSERVIFLQLISHEKVSYDFQLEPKSVVPYLTWVSKRKLRISNLAINRNVIQKHQIKCVKSSCLKHLKVLKIFDDSYHYRVGFVQLLMNCPVLEEISLSSGGVLTDDILRAMADNCKTLKKFSSHLLCRNLRRGRKWIPKSYLSKAAMVYFAEHCPTLETISFHDFKDLVDNEVIEVFAKGCKLSHIALFNTACTYHAFHSLSRHCTNIQTLQLGTEFICPEVSSLGSVVQYNKSLTELECCRNNSVANAVAHGDQLRVLKLTGCLITPAFVEAFAGSLRNLVVLRLVGQGTWSGLSGRIATLFSESCSRLEELDVSGCPLVNDAFLEAMSVNPSTRAANMHTLNISGCGLVNAVALGHLVGLRETLTFLSMKNMYYCLLTSENLCTLVTACSKLRSLVLGGPTWPRGVEIPKMFPLGETNTKGGLTVHVSIDMYYFINLLPLAAAVKGLKLVNGCL